MDPLKYGKLISHFKLNNTYILQLGEVNQAVVKQTNNENHVDIFKKGEVILSYVDRWLSNDRFERIIGKNNYLFIKHNDEFRLTLVKVHKSAKNINNLKPQKPLSKNKIATMDFETYKNLDGKLVPYLVCWYDGVVSKSYFLSDYNSPEQMITNSIKDLLRKKYNGFKIYLHNFSNFDCIFLLDTLTKLGFCHPVINNGRFISVKLTFKTKEENIKFDKIEFRDSLQLLLMSLSKLAKSFNVEVQKSIFPHRFVSRDNLNYIGTVPDFKYFDGITLNEYLDYCINFKNNNWSLRTEAIKYCNCDCISLHQILIKFNQLIFDNFKININKYPTLPSLSFAIFRTHFLKTSFVSQLSGKISKNIKLGYTGGATDMYIPTNLKNELVYAYDVNSLYPFVMSKGAMPVGKPKYFEGDIRKIDPEAFGFFYCKIITPKNLKHPILQTHVKTKAGIRTMAALGTYKDMLFSPEMDNAIRYGYNFEILWGYTFEKGNIFKDFITTLYNMRLNYAKSNPMNYIAKIIMNSLYGRFGMNDLFTSTQIVNKKDYENFEKHNLGFINEIKPLTDSYLVNLNHDYTSTELDNQLESHNVNIAIASAISSYARVVMSSFKNNPKLKLFYTDTDSIYTNLKPDQMNKLFPGIVNNKELGRLKLETVSSRAIFISPKCYYLLTDDNQEIFKVKGLNKTGLSTITGKEFEQLLKKDHQVIKKQNKWFKSISESTIIIKDTLYTIKQTSNKRELIYNTRNKLINTKPYTITEDKIVKNN
jgi:hypothetical protein